MIVQINILDLDREVQAIIKKCGSDMYRYESAPDHLYGITIKQTTKGVWVHFRLNYIDNFKTFLSNKTIEIIEE